MNDLWMFDITSRIWTWVSGSDTVDAAGVYGTKGVPSVNNYHGGREHHSMIFHSSLNCLFAFGGTGYATLGDFGMFVVINRE